MRIINQARNTILADQVIVADNPFTRMKGLFGRDEFKKGEALIIKPCNSVHTLFMPFSIDVLFVDKNNQVVKILVG
ncbi:MAG: DUF192 domain-containing protein [Candidatus Omnitrophica bacterium]|nr:DUF192 domain-containing protein [Candidatus Omnitrophota bacterium]